MNLLTLPLLLALFSPPEVLVPVPAPPAPVLVLPPNPERRARRLFIAAGVLLGVGFVAEVVGASVSTNCSPGEPCTLGATLEWGHAADNRYTLISAGTGSAYMLSRLASTTVIWSSKALMSLGAQAQGIADASAGVPNRIPKPLAWALFGSGLGVYVGSRLARLGFALSGVCQQPTCVYAFDLTTLGVSRSLSTPGSAFLIHRRTQKRVRMGVVPMGSYGLALAGEF